VRIRSCHILALCGLAVAGCSEPKPPVLERWVGTNAADFELNDLGGHSARLSQYRGTPVILSFWSYH